jgi:hypothetical protein
MRCFADGSGPCVKRHVFLRSAIVSHHIIPGIDHCLPPNKERVSAFLKGLVLPSVRAGLALVGGANVSVISRVDAFLTA